LSAWQTPAPLRILRDKFVAVTWGLTLFANKFQFDVSVELWGSDPTRQPILTGIASVLMRWNLYVFFRIMGALLTLQLLSGCSPKTVAANDTTIGNESSLALRQPNTLEFTVLSPTTLELSFVTTKEPDPARPMQWDFVNPDGGANLPAPSDFVVSANGQNIPVSSIGFKRRVLYAPFKKRDLRIANFVYLQLSSPLADGQTVEVQNPSGKVLQAQGRASAANDPKRISPAIHVNQTGYVPAFPKKAMVGYFLGSAGELSLQTPNGATNGSIKFSLVESVSGKEVFSGKLQPRRDEGFPSPAYQNVLEADFSEFKTPGQYQLTVPGLGRSSPFFIDDGIAAGLARTYALGIYHQRCGAANELPFTRFTHDACHTIPAEVPKPGGSDTEQFLLQETSNAKENPRHTAPPLKDFASSLYPYLTQGRIDVSGGHHDAGDYSKYTANSATFIHLLVFAADVLPGVAELDNLGLSESGDKKSDILQEAKWEADFLAKMQDSDGAFYFLVYPRDRRYENDVTPDKGDPQIVWPKTTAATAAAVAALAQCAGSPKFKQQFPHAAALYLDKARKGWAFLEDAMRRHGKDGAYQKITHYGDEFIHDDEVAWAACELFLATGDPAFQQKLVESFDPASSDTRRWGWWRLYECYGHAIRSYAFAAQTGKIKAGKLDTNFLAKCRNEIAAAGQEQLDRAEKSAYGTSFPLETKAVRSAGWYFSGDAAFDLAVASQLDYPVGADPRKKFLEAMLSNLNYENGCNPINVCYLTGLGWKRQREIVHQYAQNDRRILPPSGIPLGNIQAAFGWMDLYQKELNTLSFPPDEDPQKPYPFYDRWGDTFNLSQEFVIVNQARSLAAAALLMTKTPLTNQQWRSAFAQIQPVTTNSADKSFTLSLSNTNLDLSRARIVWEADGREPLLGNRLIIPSTEPRPEWIEAEAQFPDGRRVFAVTNSASRLFGKR
jgi:hypothetical protein